MNDWYLHYVEPKQSHTRRDTIGLPAAPIRRPSAVTPHGNETRLRSALRTLRIA